MEKAEAVELVERWLRAQGFQIGEPGGRMVDLGGVHRSGEGWRVPFNTTEAVADGDFMRSIVPYPECVVTEPDGELRMVNTTPYPGFSAPLAWPGEPRWSEVVDPDYEAAGLYDMGVPKKLVAGWRITHPDGRTEEKVNPDYQPDAVRLGYPVPENGCEALLNYLSAGQMARPNVVLGFFGGDVLIPGDADRPPEQRLTMRGFTSPRRVAEAVSWWRMSLATFVDRYPGASLAVNPTTFPSVTFEAAELAEAYEHLSRSITTLGMTSEGIKPGEPVYDARNDR